MGKIAKKPQPPAAPDEEDEDPIWGNALADFFGVRALGSLSAAVPPVPEDKPPAARKRAAPRQPASVAKGTANRG